ncbi:MAG: DUF937 domain-containing protein [Alphaproteobacteria bacterium]|jgi:hypothetical protein|nr:DUF937 domain-containing protein [Alphaproteobacteria bacterium]MBU1552480.1 DUF937 domain-containing protein [Alphaproteobacteria bacterium]MBU2339489.1 DUF937 domain-containing protein [Alphaproteobacteria bacterium]MBU2390201.1 DUF937 domain-containing protein [Alphaproteobacteria bacterium]
MLPLFDMMLKAQNGAAMDAMARQFNLAQEQAAQAMAALTPAFSSGLKRTATNPYDFGALMNTMMSGSYAKYFEDLGKTFTPQGVADGNAVLEKLFGSPEVSRAIAAQAEQLTGVGQDILKKMMPAMADTLMGGMFKQATGQMQQGGDIFASTPMGQMTKQWLDSLGLQPKQAASQNPMDVFDNPFMQSMRSAWGMDKTAAPQQPSPAAMLADNPFMQAFQEMMSGSFGHAASAKSPSQGEASAAANPYAETLNSMFDSGLEVQKTYQKNMEAIFDTYFKGATTSPAASEPSKA